MKDIKGGKINFRIDKQANLHFVIGKASFDEKQIGGDVEILRLPADQQVAHTTADEKAHEACIAQPIEHPQRVRRDMSARNDVIRSRYDPRGRSGRHEGRGGRVQFPGFRLSNQLSSQ